MKKLEIIIRPEKLENLKAILEGCRVNGIMISNVMGYGNQKGYTQMYRGTKYNVNLLPKVKVETVIPKELADPIIDAVVDEINTGLRRSGRHPDPYRRARTRGSVAPPAIPYHRPCGRGLTVPL